MDMKAIYKEWQIFLQSAFSDWQLSHSNFLFV